VELGCARALKVQPHDGVGVFKTVRYLFDREVFTYELPTAVKTVPRHLCNVDEEGSAAVTGSG
jgi:hypothetical protein